ncbi:MAG: hypothetical protein ACFB0G_20650 [Leptolyngbyaceae cyanobacterium]
MSCQTWVKSVHQHVNQPLLAFGAACPGGLGEVPQAVGLLAQA